MRENIQAVVSRSGRFLEGPAQIVADFTESISFDSMLAEADIIVLQFFSIIKQP